MEFGSGAFEGTYSFKSRMEDGPGTNPEELIGAAHAGCFSMALSGVLGADGHEPESIKTDAKVRFDKQGEGWAITSIALTTRGARPGHGQRRASSRRPRSRRRTARSRRPSTAGSRSAWTRRWRASARRRRG